VRQTSQFGKPICRVCAVDPSSLEITMRKLGLTSTLLVGIAASLAGLHDAAATTVAGTPFQSFDLTTSGGVVNPEIIVGFNPQPDPPGDNSKNTIDLTNPSNPVIHSGFQSASQFGFGISFLGIGNPILLPTDTSAGKFSFDALVHDRTVTFTVEVAFTNDQGIPASSCTWGAFNPQPDPPGDVLGALVNIGDADASFQILEGDKPLSFTLVPEPADLALLGFSLLGFATFRVARRRAE
jgi:hypothetical protein